MRLMRPCAFANDERANRSSASLCRSPITYVGFSAAGAACPMARSQDPHSVRWPACWQAAYSRSAWSEIFVDSPARPTRPPIPAISRAACSRSGVGVGWPRVAGTARNARVGSRRCGGDDVALSWRRVLLAEKPHESRDCVRSQPQVGHCRHRSPRCPDKRRGRRMMCSCLLGKRRTRNATPCGFTREQPMASAWMTKAAILIFHSPPNSMYKTCTMSSHGCRLSCCARARASTYRRVTLIGGERRRARGVDRSCSTMQAHVRRHGHEAGPSAGAERVVARTVGVAPVAVPPTRAPRSPVLNGHETDRRRNGESDRPK